MSISVNDHSAILKNTDVCKLMANGVLYNEDHSLILIQREYKIIGQQFVCIDSPTNVEITFDIAKVDGDDLTVIAHDIVATGAPAQAYFYAYERLVACVDGDSQP